MTRSTDSNSPARFAAATGGHRRPLARRVASVVLTAAALTFGAATASPAQEATKAPDAPKASVVLNLRDTKLGSIIVDEKGMSLYMFVPDARNVSNCEGACLAAWPPVMLGAGETLANVKVDAGLRRSLLGVALRFDGSRQVTYNGYPLYYWVRDKVAGDVTGQWVGSVWFVLSPAGHPLSARP